MKNEGTYFMRTMRFIRNWTIVAILVGALLMGIPAERKSICGWRMPNERTQDSFNKKPYLNARTVEFICFRLLQAHTLQT